jgi:transcriptional regulator with XRE-family HTH domain
VKYDAIKIKRRIKELCKVRKVSQKELLDKCDLSRTTLDSTNTSMPKVDNLAKIADFFDLSVDYFLDRHSEQKAIAAIIDVNINLNIMINLFKQLPENRQGDLIIIAQAFLMSDEKIMPKAKNADLV